MYELKIIINNKYYENNCLKIDKKNKWQNW